MDDARILQLAEETGGYVNKELVADHLRWDEARIERVLERLTKDGRIWIDSQPADNSVHYWFPSLFLEQFSQLDSAATSQAVSGSG